MMTFCNLFSSNFVIILTMQFIREICMYSLTEVGLLSLGTRDMKALLMHCISPESLKNSRQRCYMSCFIMDQHFLRKAPLNPSVPEALSNGRCLTTKSISS
jgi:hypothetical protein